MKLNLYFLTFMFTLLGIHAFAQNRIVGGTTIDISQRPFQVFVTAIDTNNEYVYRGGGVIINNEWILTAAHVVDKSDVYGTTVTVGRTDVSNYTVFGERCIDAIHIHPNYVAGSHDASNDIALLKLSVPLSFSSTIAPISVSSESNYQIGSSAIISGWGTIGNNVFDYTHLKRTTVNISSISSNIISAISSGNYPSDGDSGGPLTNNNGSILQLIGIFSNSTASSSPTTNYCKVSAKKSWMASHGVNFYSVSGASIMAQNGTATFSYSAPGGTLELSSNLQEISRTASTITVRARGNGNAYINVIAGNNIMSQASITIGAPIITGINWDGRILRVMESGHSGIYWTEWNINGNTYTTYDDFLYPSQLPIGWATVRVRAQNNYGISNWYEEQIYFDISGGFYSIGYNSEANEIIIRPTQMLTDDSLKTNNENVSFKITDIKTGRAVYSGILPSKGGVINCQTIENGVYTVTIDYNGNRVSKKISK